MIFKANEKRKSRRENPRKDFEFRLMWQLTCDGIDGDDDPVSYSFCLPTWTSVMNFKNLSINSHFVHQMKRLAWIPTDVEARTLMRSDSVPMNTFKAFDKFPGIVSTTKKVNKR